MAWPPPFCSSNQTFPCPLLYFLFPFLLSFELSPPFLLFQLNSFKPLWPLPLGSCFASQIKLLSYCWVPAQSRGIAFLGGPWPCTCASRCCTLLHLDSPSLFFRIEFSRPLVYQVWLQCIYFYPAWGLHFPYWPRYLIAGSTGHSIT